MNAYQSGENVMKTTRTLTISVLLLICCGLAASVAIGADKQEAAQLAQQGWAHWQKGEMAEAAAKFQQAVKLDPKNQAALNGLGWASLNSGNAAEAQKAFERLVALNPRHGAALNGLGQLYLSQRKYDKAETYLVKAAATAPAAWYGLARLYLLQEKFDKAEKWAQKVVSSGQADESAKEMLQAAKDKRLSDELRQKIEPPEPAAEAAETPTEKK
jgi:Flp pilus assembly protein TadD